MSESEENGENGDVMKYWLKSHGNIINYISRKVSHMRTESTQGTSLGKPLIPAQVIFNDVLKLFDITEQMFVQALLILRLKRKYIYDALEIPERLHPDCTTFYEALPDKNKLYCMVKKPIDAETIYDNIQENRTWNINEFVWVPSDHPMVIDYLLNKSLVLIEEVLKDHKNNNRLTTL